MSPKQIFDDKKIIRPQKRESEEAKSADTPKTPPVSGHLDAGTVTHLQQTAGNSAVQRLLAQREAAGPGVVDDETASEIQREKGHGQSLDGTTAQQTGQVIGHDVSDVTVHTDARADKLARKLGAKAFTTGKDVFFREGEYQPNSRDGQRLLGHELTHVAQQSQGIQSKSAPGEMSVNDPDDQYEAEADRVADSVVSAPAADVQRQEEEEEVQMQEEEEEVQMQEEEEELQMQEEEEEVQMQGAEEEEMIKG